MYITQKPPTLLTVSLLLVSTLLNFSCAGLQPQRSQGPAYSGIVPEAPPERPIPEIPLHILGEGQVPPGTLSRFLLVINSNAEEEFVAELTQFYAEEAEDEGVNHDVAFAQMCLETGFLRYGNLVTPDMNNFCGLGAIGPGQNGEHFDTPRTGVQAHIQHLKAYATDAPLNKDLVDPRYRWVRYGTAPTIYGLAGTWATDKEYAEKIKSILEELYQFTYSGKMDSNREVL
ncbi:MAG: glucosaminidase domain-containing protein [Treponema sp.]|jgi:hypothetical protein|nr:glucosaminidase domain-containing protein [Treponema sp.]